jgi:succinoglycan biosynthesis transport protein ExoP
MTSVTQNAPSKIHGLASFKFSGPRDVLDLWATLSRGRRVIAQSAIITTLLAASYLIVETPLFEANSEIIIDTTTSHSMQSKGVGGGGTDSAVDAIDNNLVDSEAEVLGSDGFGEKVIRDLGLQDDPEFVGRPQRFFPMVLSYVIGAVESVKGLLGKADAPDDPVQRALAVYQKRLKVKRDALTYLIDISFQSTDSAKAAKIANTIAEDYQKHTLAEKYLAASRTSDWLQGQLTDIRKRALEADRAVQEFKATNHIVDTSRGLVSDQQVSDLNSQLVLAQAAVAEAQAKLDSARQAAQDPAGTHTVSDAVNNPVIARLRAQYLDLMAKTGDIASRFGPQHGAVIANRRQMNEILIAIRSETARVIDAYENDYKVALSRQKSLEASIDKVVLDSNPTSLAQVQLRDLQSSAETSRALLTGYLQKLQDASQLETFPVSDARIVTRAVAPLKPSNPKSVIILPAGIIAGLLLGAAIVVGRELTNMTFVNGRDLQDFTGLRFLGNLPKIPPQGAPKTAGSNPSKRLIAYPVDRYATDAPFSRFTETLRNTKILIDGMDTGRPGGKVFGVTSSAPREGKTVVAFNVAQVLARTGKPTILVDCDLRTCSLTSRLAASVNVGLLEALIAPERLPEAILRDKASGLDILPCAAAKFDLNIIGAIASPHMTRLLNALRAKYHYVVLDIAPVVPVVDAREMASSVDGYIFVVKWSETDRRMVDEAIHTENVRPKIVGTLMNGIEPQYLRELESHHGSTLGRYYTDH